MADWSKWDQYQDFVIDPSQVDADLTDYPVYLRGSDLDTDHRIWTEAASDGKDIKTSKSDDTEIPVEIVTFDQAGKDFEIHTKFSGTLSSTTGGTVRLNFGNPSDAAHAESDANGRENVWNSDYKGVWHLPEDPSGSAPQMMDSTSDGNDGTTSGTMTSDDSVAAQLGNGLDLDGFNDHVDMGDVLDVPDDMTVQAWIKTSGTPTSDMIVSKKTGGGAGWFIWVDGSGKLQFFAGDGADDVYPASTASINDNAYHMIHATLIGNTGKCYIDGVEDGSETDGGTIGSLSNALNLKIGDSDHAADYHFQGIVDEVRLLHAGMTSTWISTEYNNQNSPETFYALPRAIQRHRNPVLSAA